MGAEGILGAGMGLVGTLVGMNSQEQAMQDQWRLERKKWLYRPNTTKSKRIIASS